jgi:hypothetical protein
MNCARWHGSLCLFLPNPEVLHVRFCAAAAGKADIVKTKHRKSRALTNTVLSPMDASSPGHQLIPVDGGRLKRSVYLLVGFLVGCVVAAAAISVLGDWSWSLPVTLAALAIGFARA